MRSSPSAGSRPTTGSVSTAGRGCSRRGWAPVRCPGRRAKPGGRPAISRAISAARVAGADDEDSTFTQLVGIAVLGRMELDDGAVELGREGRDERVLIGAGRHHDVVGKELIIARGHDKAISGVRQPVDLDPGSNREPEPLGVGLEVVGGLILGGVGRSGARERACPAARCRTAGVNSRRESHLFRQTSPIRGFSSRIRKGRSLRWR